MIPIKDLKTWIIALRSGKYGQTQGNLQDVNGYCCLGVGCEVFIPEPKRRLQNQKYLFGGMPHQQPAAPDWLKHVNDDFDDKTGIELTDINDGNAIYGSFTFDEIADLLELVYIHKILD